MKKLSVDMDTLSVSNSNVSQRVGSSRRMSTAVGLSPGPTGSRRMSTIVGFSPAPTGSTASSGGIGKGLAGLMMMKRKLSHWRANRASTVTIKKKLENTYRMEPSQRGKFCSAAVEKTIREVLEEMLQNERGYVAQHTTRLSKPIASAIQARVKAMGYDRYKLVVTVMLLQEKDQGVQAASRALWDDDKDNFAEAEYKRGDLIAVANVYGIYFE